MRLTPTEAYMITKCLTFHSRVGPILLKGEPQIQKYWTAISNTERYSHTRSLLPTIIDQEACDFP